MLGFNDGDGDIMLLSRPGRKTTFQYLCFSKKPNNDPSERIEDKLMKKLP